MSTIGSYPTRTFKESQKFLVLDPETQSSSLVLGRDLVSYLTPSQNYVYAESTRATAQATDYPVGALIETAGATSQGDNFAAVYLVVAAGQGDFPMDNGNELLVIRGDEFLREQLVQPVATFNNVADMVADLTLPTNRKARTLGYYAPGDGGGNDYEIVAGGTGTADGGSFIDLDNGLQARGLFGAGLLNVKQWGADGSGSDSTKDTSAIDSVFAFIEANPSYQISPLLNGASGILNDQAGAPPVYFPKGVYLYNGSGYVNSANKVLKILGDGQGHSTVKILSDCHLVLNTDASSDLFAYVEFRNIRIHGGRGAFYITKTNLSNVQHARRFYDCTFTGYTSVAVGCLNEKDTRWVYQGCIFEGGNTGTPVGMMLPHEIADCDISGNTFRSNKYHIIARPTATGYQIGPNNAFFNAGIIDRVADIWIIPADPVDFPALAETNGSGLRIVGNRHSNEFADNDYIILIADDASVNATTISHSTARSVGRCVQMSVTDYYAARSGGESIFNNPGLIYSYTGYTGGLQVDGTQAYNIPYIIEFDPSVTNADIDAGENFLNRYYPRIANEVNGADSVVEFSNRNGAGITCNPQASLGYIGEVSSGKDQTSVTNLLTSNNAITSLLSGTNATISGSQADSDGGTDAATITWTGATDNKVFLNTNGFDASRLKAGDLMWVEFDVIRSETNPIDAFQLLIDVGGSFGRVTIPTTTEWRRVVFPVVFADDYTAGGMSIAISPGSNFLTIGTKDSVKIGRRAIYHSASPASYLLVSTQLPEKTIAAGEITVTNNNTSFSVDTEAGAATDDLTTINGGYFGQVISFRAADFARTVVVKDGIGNLRLSGDMTLDSADDSITLMLAYTGTWTELSRSNNS